MASTIFVSDKVETSPFLASKVISAIDYIKGAPADAIPGTIVMNIGREHGYLTLGYYVSLLAEARGHRPLPSTTDIHACGVKVTDAGERSRTDLQRLLPRSPVSPFYKTLRTQADWLSPSRAALDCFKLGVLLTETEPFGASSRSSIEDFARSAVSYNLDVFLLGKTQIDEVDGIDGLFIRDLTTPVSHAYQFAQRAAGLGIPVIDDPTSIICCSNKAFVHERLKMHGILVPRTVLMTPDLSMECAVEELGLPLVLKIPDGSFCVGIQKARSLEEGDRLLAEMRQNHCVLIAQEYLPTEFDWRIGILDGKPLFACKYYMARGHWQVINYVADAPSEVGEVVAVPLSDVPPTLLACASRTGAVLGNGLYGIDIKEWRGTYYVIEVNCNPDIDSGSEVSERQWSLLAEWFRTSIERTDRANCKPPTFSERATGSCASARR